MKRLQILIEEDLDGALTLQAAAGALLRRRHELRDHAPPADDQVLAFDGDFTAAGFVELRP
ncbi:MAG: hypothetical protein ACRDYX_05665 [Egibacteraceae bacterium]